MSSSAYRNAMRRRTYRERAQPKARQGLGLLEKHKDYKQRAQDYHRKEDEINRLREIARLRNPDEFNFRMTHEKTTKGVHVLKRDDKSPHVKAPAYVRDPKLLAHMKDQDLNYSVIQQQHEDRVIARLRSSLHCLDASTHVPQKKHVVFTETVDEALQFDPAKHFKTAPALIQRTHNRLTAEQLASQPIAVNQNDGVSLQQAEKAREGAYRELMTHIGRKRKLDEDVHKFEASKKLRTKGNRKKVVVLDKFGDEDKEKTYYKWKNERKK